jgi:hypothetical protein
MALYIPRSIFHLARLLYVRLESFLPTLVSGRFHTPTIATPGKQPPWRKFGERLNGPQIFAYYSTPFSALKEMAKIIFLIKKKHFRHSSEPRSVTGIR